MSKYSEKNSVKLPEPLFDTIDKVKEFEYKSEQLTQPNLSDYYQAIKFLKSYDGSDATFNAYRREIERFLHWSWLIAKKSIKEMKRTEIESYLTFCQSPPVEWIGIKKVPRFIEKNNQRVPNPEWRPFVATISKSAYRLGKKAEIKNYELSSSALRDIFSILSSFYNFLIHEDYTDVNPILHVRQKSKYIRKHQNKQKIRRLSELQWHYVIETAEIMANENSNDHRTLFIMTALYAMYLRISELAASERWIPTMSDFYRDHDGLWWFKTVGKGNKERQISVSDAMLEALKNIENQCGYHHSLLLPIKHRYYQNQKVKALFQIQHI